MSVASVINPKSILADFAVALAPFAVVGVLLAPKVGSSSFAEHSH